MWPSDSINSSEQLRNHVEPKVEAAVQQTGEEEEKVTKQIPRASSFRQLGARNASDCRPPTLINNTEKKLTQLGKNHPDQQTPKKHLKAGQFNNMFALAKGAFCKG